MFAAWLFQSKASAHPSDISHLRVRVQPQQVEFRFSLNLATLERIKLLDSDQNQRLSFAEIEAVVPTVRDFMKQSVLVSVNDEDADLGELTAHECVWPNPESSAITPPETGQRFVDFIFTKPWSAGVRDLWLGFQWYEQLGELHTTLAVYQQAGEHDHPVEFSVAEPEYLFDTGRQALPERPMPEPVSWSRWWWVTCGVGVLVLWKWWSTQSSVRKKA